MNDHVIPQVRKPGDWSSELPLAYMDAGDGTRRAITQVDDLEDYIEVLRKLDAFRRRAESLNNQEAYEALLALIDNTIAKDGNPFDNTNGFDVDDYVTAVRVAWQRSDGTNRDLRLRLEQIAEGATLDNIVKNHYDVLLATNILRGLVSTGDLALSRSGFLCWYWLLREIHLVHDAEWRVGAARAGKKGWVSGYTTAQCVRAILQLAESVNATAKVIREIGRLEDVVKRRSSRIIPETWRTVDRRRLIFSSKNTFEVLSGKTVLKITPLQDEKDFNYGTLSGLRQEVLGQLKRIVADRKKAVREIESFRRKEEKPSKNKDRREIDTSQNAHSIAQSAISGAAWQALETAIKGRRVAWIKVCDCLDDLARHIRSGLNATRGYLSSEIDHQLGALQSSDIRDSQPHELAWAAAAYGALRSEPNEDKIRLSRAALCISQNISEDGTLPKASPFHHLGLGSLVFPPSAGILTAFADLTTQVDFTLHADVAAKLLPFFEHTRSEAMKNRPRGWSSIYLRRPGQAELDHTANAIEALMAIKRMFDVAINNLILRHFSVKGPTELHGTANLDNLFYPDFGLSLGPPQIQRESVAITLQIMRAHVEGTKSALKKADPLHSLVLYGPAGTGKTTLVEALAATCNVPLVEVTPSDLSKAGEAAIERRARAVFEALSLLTHVVILFDEFDPVLKRRDITPQGATNILSFLTPGMLPKLKMLSDKAKRRSVAYVLITNLIGTLDEAAIRTGRFDKKLGIYPPDPLSRYGQLMVLCEDLIKSEPETLEEIEPTMSRRAKALSSSEMRERVCRVTAALNGGGMTTLAKPGWLRAPEVSRHLARSPIGYIFGLVNLKNIDPIEPEDMFVGMKGSGSNAEKECLEWGWLDQWDKQVHNSSTMIEGWPNDRKSREVITRLQNDVKQTRDERKLTGLLGDEIVLRWNKQLRLRLEGIFNEPFAFDAKQVGRVCNTHILSSEDLYIFKRCAEQAIARDFFKDPAVTSQVVYIYMLANDFATRQQTLKYYSNNGATYRNEIKTVWQELKENFETIDEQITVLYGLIDKDYDAYMASSDFIKFEVKRRPLVDLKRKMRLAAKQRTKNGRLSER